MPRQSNVSHLEAAIPPVREPPVRAQSSAFSVRVAVPLADFGAPPVRHGFRTQAGVRATADDSDLPAPKKSPVVVKTTSRELRAQRIANQWSGPQVTDHREGARPREGAPLDDVSVDECGPVRDPIPLEGPELPAQTPGGSVASGFVAGALAAMVLAAVVGLWLL
jgi:hypothetical protein